MGPSFEDLLRPSLGCPLELKLRVLFDAVLSLALLHESDAQEVASHCMGHVTPADIRVGATGVANLSPFTHDYRRDKLPPQPRRGYFAPELLLRKYPASRRTDTFSLGVMLWEVLTSQRLFPEGSAKTLFEKIRSHELPGPGALPPEAWALLMIAEKACSYHPKNRYENAPALLRDMDQCAGRLVGTHEQLREWVRENRTIEAKGLRPGTELSRSAPTTELSSDCSGEVHAHPIRFPRPPALPTFRGAGAMAPAEVDLAADIQRESLIPTVIPPAYTQDRLLSQSAESDEQAVPTPRLVPAPTVPLVALEAKPGAVHDSGLDMERPALHDLFHDPNAVFPPAAARQGAPKLALFAVLTTLGLGWAVFSIL